jgi:hypothetical protein
LPSTLDQGSIIIPLGVSSPTLKAGPLPQTVIAYLDTFPTVHEQLNDIPITSCAPALPVRTACTTVLTSTSTSVSCDEQDICVTAVETVVETNTHTPFWPTLNGSLTDIKRSAAMLTTETVETTTVLATAQSLVVPSSIADDEDSTLTPETRPLQARLPMSVQLLQVLLRLAWEGSSSAVLGLEHPLSPHRRT